MAGSMLRARRSGRRAEERFRSSAATTTEVILRNDSGAPLADLVDEVAQAMDDGGDRPMLIAISGQFTQTADKLLSESVGFQYFFTKPCDPNVLLKVLRILQSEE